MADQLILPGAVPIDIRDHGGGCTGIRGRGIGVDLLLSDIPPGIVGIGHRLIGELVVLPDQLVRAVVLVGDGGAAPGDRGYAPVVVVDEFTQRPRCRSSLYEWTGSLANRLAPYFRRSGHQSI